MEFKFPQDWFEPPFTEFVLVSKEELSDDEWKIVFDPLVKKGVSDIEATISSDTRFVLLQEMDYGYESTDDDDYLPDFLRDDGEEEIIEEVVEVPKPTFTPTHTQKLLLKILNKAFNDRSWGEVGLQPATFQNIMNKSKYDGITRRRPEFRKLLASLRDANMITIEKFEGWKEGDAIYSPINMIEEKEDERVGRIKHTDKFEEFVALNPLIFNSEYQPDQTLSDYSPEQLTESSAIEGFQPLKYSVVGNRAETFEADSKEEKRLKKYEKTYGKEGAKVRNRIFKRILAKAQDGTKAGQWSARKSQSLAEEYEEEMGKKGKKPYKSSKRTKSQKSLKDWGDQAAKAIKSLTDEEYKKTSAKKRKDMKKGKQFSDQPKSIADKTKKYRAEVKPVGNYSPPTNYDYRPNVGKLNYFFEQVLESASKLEKRKLKRVLGLPNDNPLTKKPMIKAASIVYLMKNDNGIIPKEWYIEYYLKNFTKRQLCYLNDIEYYQGIPITKKELADLLIIGEKGKKFESESSKKPSSVEISRSSNPEKKLMAVFYDDEGKKMKTTHFGQRGASDYTKHGDKERMERYLERHGGGFETSTKEDWKDPTTAGSLSRWILWNKPSLKSSFDDYKRRFGLKGSINVSKSAEEETSFPFLQFAGAVLLVSAIPLFLDNRRDKV